jgi:Fe-S cluster assembly iron-binding protein IscA
MICITEHAKRKLKETLATNVDMPQARLRLVDRGKGDLGLGIDIQREDDKTVVYNDSIVLIVEQKLADSLDGVTLDVEDTGEESEFVLYKTSSLLET